MNPANFRKLWRKSTRDDSGMGLILVIGISLVVFSLVATALVIASNSLRQSKNRTDFELALAAAEEGVDVAFARQQDAFNNGDVAGYAIPQPAPGADMKDGNKCIAEEVAQFDSSTEIADARAKLLELADVDGCLQSGDSGDFVMIRPKDTINSGTVYAMGWSPDKSAGSRERMLKVDYIFVPYNPQFAILTGGDVQIDGSVVVDIVDGAPAVAGVHTNMDLTFSNQSPQVCGQISGSGAVPSTGYDDPCSNIERTVQSAPVEDLPHVDPVSFYKRAPSIPSAADAINQNVWFDLCPGSGTSFQIKAYSTTGVPCTGTVMGNQDSGINFGIGFTPSGSNVGGGPTFAVANAARDGVYYAHHSNLTTKEGGSKPANPPRRTLIASAATHCAVETGNIRYSHLDMQDGPFVRNLFLLAETDLMVDANVQLGNPATPVGGMFVAGDELQLGTSSTRSVGAAVAVDNCPARVGELIDHGESIVQGITFWFDPNAESPFSALINVTLWQEN